MKIGIFDSGMGGVTVLKELLKYYPNEEYIYVGDNKNLPYGTKSKKELLSLSSKIIEFLIKEGVNIIFIACGTVSSNVYEELKQKYSIPIFNIIDTTILKLKKDDVKDVAILATHATIESHIFKNKLPDINVKEISCQAFVPLIEGIMDIKFKKLYIEQYLKDIKKQKIKNIVLGCTHYPLIESDIKDYLGDVNIYNMGTILASSIYLKDSNQSLDVYFTDNNKNLNDKVNLILGNNIVTRQIDL